MPERPAPEEFNKIPSEEIVSSQETTTTPDIRESKSVAQSSFEEWCKLNGSLDPELYIPGDLSSWEKEKSYDAVFREGAKKLAAELRDPKNNEIKLADKLELPKLKSELDLLREKGDISALSKREVEIANSFQEAISEYPYESGICHVDEILNKKEMNCVGASVLGGTLLDEVGVKYLVGHTGSHVLLIVVPSDSRVLWQDMQDGKEIKELENEELTADKIEGKKNDGTNIAPQDIAAFAKDPKKEGMTFFVKKEHWKNEPMTVLPPEFGLELNVLINTGFMLGNEGKNKEAIEVLHLAAQKSPEDGDVHLGLARAYKGLGRFQEAMEACKRSLETDPQSSYLKSLMDELRVLAEPKSRI